MSDKASIYAAFVKAQKEFAPALKSSSNPHFKSRYADLAACVEAVIDALNNHGIGLIQRPIPDDRGVTIETVFVHESGEKMNGGSMHVPASKQDPQGYGSAATYARRYGLMAACGIAPEDDDGNAASQKPAARQPRAAQAPQQAPQAPVTDAAIIATHISALEACKTLGSLKQTFGAAWKTTHGAPALKKAYDRLKMIFEATSEETPRTTDAQLQE
jgi:hypothetical protein